MKKIGIVTFYKDNFGSILQAYSVKKFVNDEGYEAFFINRINRINFKDRILNILKNVYRSIRYKGFLKHKIKQKAEKKFVLSSLSQITKNKMDEFVFAEFNVKEIINKDLKKLNDECYKCIVGSDQVWNVTSNFDDYYFLSFMDKDKKIALSPSFATNSIPSYYKKFVGNSLKTFNVLSVREETGVKIIKELIGIDAVRLPDPTIIYSKDEWSEFSKSGIKKDNYILLHFLGIRNDIAINTINEFIEKYECNVYCIVNKYDKYKELKKYEFIDVDPRDYVSLINDAKFVFTDSFHSTLFSINLNTEFIAFDRQLIHGKSQKSRIVDLLKRFHLENRFFESDNKNIDKLPQIDYRIIEQERLAIRKYLHEKLKNKIYN